MMKVVRRISITFLYTFYKRGYLQWSIVVEHAVTSATRGEFDDRVQAVLHHAPPGSTVLLCVDFNKARQALVGAAVTNVGAPDVRRQLHKKYPPEQYPRPLLDNDAIKMRAQPVDHGTICFSDAEWLLTHIIAKKRGASKSTCGHSNDDYQDILRHDPTEIRCIIQLCNLIAIGTLTIHGNSSRM